MSFLVTAQVSPDRIHSDIHLAFFHDLMKVENRNFPNVLIPKFGYDI